MERFFEEVATLSEESSNDPVENQLQIGNDQGQVQEEIANPNGQGNVIILQNSEGLQSQAIVQ